MSTNAASGPATPVRVAILRKVRGGCEVEFESQIAKFFGKASREPGVSASYLIRPVPGSDTREYGILRSFKSEEDMRRFYDSDLYREWQSMVQPLVEGEPYRRQIHGLEAFFRAGGDPPLAWKMAVVTWIGVNPAVYISSWAVAGVFGKIPGLVELLVVNLLVVASLTWFFMPILTKLFRRWLQMGSN